MNNPNVQDATEIAQEAQSTAAHYRFMAEHGQNDAWHTGDWSSVKAHEQDAEDYEQIADAAGHGLLAWLFGGK